MKEKNKEKKKHGLRITYNSPVVISFAALTLVVMLASIATKGKSDLLLFSTYRSSLTSPMTYLRMLFHVLGSSGWSQYLENTMLLLAVGPMLEEKYGSKRIFSMMIITSLLTGIANTIFSGTVLMGSSEIIFAMVLMASFVCVHGKEIPLTAILVGVLYAWQQISAGLIVDGSIANLANLIGAAVGACSAIFIIYPIGVKPGDAPPAPPEGS